MSHSTAIVWFRRDLRLADNPALDRARREHERVVPVFIWDPDAEGDWAPGAAGRWWLHHSLAALAERLDQRGSRLIIAAGDTAEALERIRKVTGADAVYWNRLYEPALIERDRKLKASLREQGLVAESCNGALLFEPWQLVKDDKSPYLVFTPFWKQMQKRWQAPSVCPEPRQLDGPARWPASLALEELKLLPEIDWADGFGERWSPGELAARRRLEHFVDDPVTDYDAARDRPDRAGTSRLSPHLHFGEVSPRQVALALDEAGELPRGKGKLSLLREIAWREFSWSLLFHHPHLPDKALKTPFQDFPWRDRADYQDDLKAWQRGQTGIPMVDAGMRELWTTGWMHNRVRMVVASFLTKNLLIPWQEGAKWFWDTLVDADLGNNTQGWQWTAGCGADAAPYFRVFNPVLQGEKFDPQGDYVRRWCPELAKRPAKRIHHPLADGERCGDYPRPIVDLKGSRERALAAYQSMR
ncbi:MAG: deoxyribodipyrimidine photo-lyase [Wenzhouxiangellaceae bacterium]|nr:MAG: deoxyribodipyrimidine photo-lyase [Wenzhouxiangellaceae bacterium]